MVLEAIMLGEQVGSRYVGQSALEVCAGLMAIADNWSCCARLYGAAQTQSSRTGFKPDAADEAFLAPLVQRARDALAEGYELGEAQGRALTYDAAIADARACLACLSTAPS